jgi:CRP-like cAMP-binding protein
MFADQLRRAIEVSPRANYPQLSTALWKALANGLVTEDEASALSGALEARKAVPAPGKPVRRHVGSRPRSPASIERRRRWASSGAMPPQLQARFTLAESAVLAVVAAEVRVKGSCSLTVGHIAALAGVCPQTVRNALREAVGHGLIRVEERRLTAWRNAPNRVTITSPEWNVWLRMGRRGVGQNPLSARIQGRGEGAACRPQRAIGKEGGGRSEARFWRDERTRFRK